MIILFRALELWINKKRCFFDNVWKWAIINSTGKKFLPKPKERYFKEKVVEYCLKNKEVIKGETRKHYKNLSQEEKEKIKEYQKKRYQQLVQYKKEALRNKWFFVFS